MSPAVSTATNVAPAPEAADAGRPLPRPPRRRRRRWWVRVAAGLLLPVGLLVTWQLVAASGVYSAAQLPPPVDVVLALRELAARGELWQHLGISAQRVLIGFSAGSAVGLALGGLVGLVPLARTVFAPTVQAIRAIPSLAWVPLLLLWLGIGETPKVVLIAIGAFFPVYTTVASALAHVDPHLVELGRAYGRRGLRLLATVQLPAAVPPVLAGLRLAMAQSWLFLVAAELIASSMGLGFVLIDSQNTGRTDLTLLAIVLLALLGKTCDSVFGLVERWLPAARR